MGSGSMCIKKPAGDQDPDNRAICASLASSIDGKQFAMREIFLRESEFGLENVFCLMKKSGMDDAQGFVLAKSSCS